MEHGSSGLDSVLPAYRPCVDPMRIPSDKSAALCVVFVKTSVVDVSRIKVKHRKTGLCACFACHRRTVCCLLPSSFTELIICIICMYKK